MRFSVKSHSFLCEWPCEQQIRARPGPEGCLPVYDDGSTIAVSSGSQILKVGPGAQPSVEAFRRKNCSNQPKCKAKILLKKYRWGGDSFPGTLQPLFLFVFQYTLEVSRL